MDDVNRKTEKRTNVQMESNKSTLFWSFLMLKTNLWKFDDAELRIYEEIHQIIQCLGFGENTFYLLTLDSDSFWKSWIIFYYQLSHINMLHVWMTYSI